MHSDRREFRDFMNSATNASTSGVRRRRVWLFRIAAIVLPLVVGFACAEMYFRIHDLRKSSVYEQASNRIDSDFGWYPKEYFESSGQATDSVGQLRHYRFTTGEFGFRRWPEHVGERQKVLVVGDSFTQAEKIDDSKTYFARLDDLIEADVFAFGCSGYGTLQECLLIDRQFHRIKPDVIVLQVCSNDFVNSSVELENASRRHNNGLRRPYPEPDGNIHWDVPRKLKAISWLSVNSRFLFWLVKRVDQARAGFDVPDGTFRVTRPILPDDPQAKELERTTLAIGELFRRLRQMAGEHTQVIIFPVDQDKPYYALWQKLADDNGFAFAGEFEANLHAEEEKAGKPIGRIDDHHWNELGHERAAEYLKEIVNQALERAKSIPVSDELNNSLQ
jgi:hypothetical protein